MALQVKAHSLLILLIISIVIKLKKIFNTVKNDVFYSHKNLNKYVLEI